MRNPLTVEFILTKQVLAWCHGGWATGGCGGGGWVAGKGTGNHLLVVDQAPSDFSELQNCHQQSQQFLENEKLGVSQKAPVVTSRGRAVENIQSPRARLPLCEHRVLES